MLNTSLGYEYILNDSQILVKLNPTRTCCWLVGLCYEAGKLNILIISLVCIDGRFSKIQSHIHKAYNYILTRYLLEDFSAGIGLHFSQYS